MVWQNQQRDSRVKVRPRSVLRFATPSRPQPLLLSMRIHRSHVCCRSTIKKLGRRSYTHARGGTYAVHKESTHTPVKFRRNRLAKFFGVVAQRNEQADGEIMIINRRALSLRFWSYRSAGYQKYAGLRDRTWIKVLPCATPVFLAWSRAGARTRARGQKISTNAKQCRPLTQLSFTAWGQGEDNFPSLLFRIRFCVCLFVCFTGASLFMLGL